MGTVFGFVSSDVTSKLEILSTFRKGEHGEEFSTIEGMILHEEAAKKFEDPKYISASRTLLRLHRALCNLIIIPFLSESHLRLFAVFIALFLEELFQLKNDDKLASSCQKVYSATLGKFHPWLIQKAAIMAMYALPTKSGLLHRVTSCSS